MFCLFQGQEPAGQVPRGGTIQRPLQRQGRDVFQPPDGQARNRPAYSAGIFPFSPNLYFLIYAFLNSILIGPFLILFLSLLYSISFFQARTTSCQGSLLCSLRSSRGLTPPPGTGDLLIRSGLHLSRDGHDWFLLVCPAILPLVLRRTSTSYVSVVRLRLTSPSYVSSYVRARGHRGASEARKNVRSDLQSAASLARATTNSNLSRVSTSSHLPTFGM